MSAQTLAVPDDSQSFSLTTVYDHSTGVELVSCFIFALVLFAIGKAVRACFPPDRLIVLHLE